MEDEHGLGQPISYLVLRSGTAVYAEGGLVVGRVKRVQADTQSHIFDGIVIDTHHGDRFVDATEVGAIHERAVAVRLTVEECVELPHPSDPSSIRGSAGSDGKTPLDHIRDLDDRAWSWLTGRR